MYKKAKLYFNFHFAIAGEKKILVLVLEKAGQEERNGKEFF